MTFSASVMLRSVITQGRQDADQWVTSYQLQYSPDNVNYFYVRDVDNNIGLFPGNTDRNTKVENFVPPGIVARSVKLMVKSWRQHISMRFDVTGCSVAGELPAIPTISYSYVSIIISLYSYWLAI